MSPIPKLSDIDLGNTRGRRMEVCVVSSEFLGPVKNGGIATATSGLVRQLLADGHKVTLLYTLVERGTPASGSQPWTHWVETLAAQGVKLMHIPHLADYRAWREKSWHVREFLGQHQFDLVYFNEHHGSGYYSLCAKRAGLLPFASQVHCVITHGSMEWVFNINDQYACLPADIEVIALERRSVELADVVLAPSRYLVEEYANYGWSLPARTYQQPYALFRDTTTRSDTKRRPINELVFFGRLEVRKGLWLFCEALDRLKDKLSGNTVTFLGRLTETAGLSSGLQILNRASSWGFRVKLLTDFDTEQALRYLSGPGRLAVMPSLADNSPCVLYECMEAGIPFVSTRGSGGDELVHPDCWPDMMVEPTTDALALALESILSRGALLGKPRFDPGGILDTWSKWHSYVSTHREQIVVPAGAAGSSAGAIARTGKPLIVFAESGHGSVSSLIANIGSHIKRFGASCEYLVILSRQNALVGLVAALAPDGAEVKVRVLPATAADEICALVAGSRYAFVTDAMAEIQTAFFLLACNLFERDAVGVVTCVTAARNDTGEPVIAMLPTGHLPGCVGLGYPGCGETWAVSPEAWGEHARIGELYDQVSDTFIASDELGGRLVQRCLKSGGRVDLLPVVGAIASSASGAAKRPNAAYRRIRQLAREWEMTPTVSAGGPAWFSMSAVGGLSDEPAELAHWPESLPEQHPLGGLGNWTDFPAVAASMGRAELALQLEAGAGASANRTRDLIELAAAAARNRPQLDLARVLYAGAVGNFGAQPWPELGETSATGLATTAGQRSPASADFDEGSTSQSRAPRGVTAYADARTIRLRRNRLRSVTSDAVGRLVFFDVPLCGNASVTVTLKSLGAGEPSVRLLVVDQAVGSVIGEVSDVVSRDESRRIAVDLHGIYGYASIVLELAAAPRAEAEIDSIVVF